MRRGGLEARGESTNPIASPTIHHILLILLCHYIFIQYRYIGIWSQEIDGLKLGYLSFFACIRARSHRARGTRGRKKQSPKVSNRFRLARSMQKGKILADRGGAPQHRSDTSQMSWRWLIRLRCLVRDCSAKNIEKKH